MEAEIFNNVDNPSGHQHYEEEPAGGKRGGKGKSAERLDTKVLEWTSFSPALIREKYLEMKRFSRRSEKGP